MQLCSCVCRGLKTTLGSVLYSLSAFSVRVCNLPEDYRIGQARQADYTKDLPDFGSHQWDCHTWHLCVGQLQGSAWLLGGGRFHRFWIVHGCQAGVDSVDSGPVFFNLRIMTPTGVSYHTPFISDIYSMICNSRTCLLRNSNINNFVVGCLHNMRNYIKVSQFQEG